MRNEYVRLNLLVPPSVKLILLQEAERKGVKPSQIGRQVMVQWAFHITSHKKGSDNAKGSQARTRIDKRIN